MDASKGFIKDGPKNRLRERDIHKIVDVFTRQLERQPIRIRANEEIRHDYNLNLPLHRRSEPEDLQDIEAHLRGGIHERDIDTLVAYWQVCPKLRETLRAATARLSGVGGTTDRAEGHDHGPSPVRRLPGGDVRAL